MVQDARNIGGEEVLAFADAQYGWWAQARGDQLIGLMRREYADGESSSETLDGPTDGFFQR
jgi:hypothetical protein